MRIEAAKIEKFLKKVDKSFPVPLSDKTDLHEYACKLNEKATLCVLKIGTEIVAMVAGYTEKLVDNHAYIALVAVCEAYRGKGIAKKLLKQFVVICKEKGIDAIHLYTVPDNKTAINLYYGLGFEKFILYDEPRPQDLHLIYYIKK